MRMVKRVVPGHQEIMPGKQTFCSHQTCNQNTNRQCSVGLGGQVTRTVKKNRMRSETAHTRSNRSLNKPRLPKGPATRRKPTQLHRQLKDTMDSGLAHAPGLGLSVQIRRPKLPWKSQRRTCWLPQPSCQNLALCLAHAHSSSASW